MQSLDVVIGECDSGASIESSHLCSNNVTQEMSRRTPSGGCQISARQIR
jgi:hypothetical protein